MVSKVAVIALVGILAVPILLGYAMNVQQVTETDYKINGDSVNVSELLKSGSSYGYANANTYQVNTNAIMSSIDTLPLYESRANVAVSPLFSRIFTNTALENTDYDMWIDSNWGLNIYNSTSSKYLRVQVYYVDSSDVQHLYNTYNNVINGSYDDLSKTLRLAYVDGSNNIQTMEYTNDKIRMRFVYVGGFSANDAGIAWGAPYGGSPPGYVDFSAGFRLKMTNYGNNLTGVKLPEYTKSYLITINLDSITDDNYEFVLNTYVSAHRFTKTTVDDVVTWTRDDGYGDYTNLYYDPSRNDNTYQIYEELSFDHESGGYNYYDVHSEFRYVGDWPTTLGVANTYITYVDELDDKPIHTSIDTGGFNTVRFHLLSSDSQTVTPIVRMDAAYFRAFEYPIIQDKTYTPASFKNNPSTTIKDIRTFGSAIVFGGNTYLVNNGNITLGTHKISVNNMVFDSVPSSNGGYDNRINGLTVSNSVSPSTISFVGQWSASISTTSLEQITVTKTEWVAGSFGWDGLDHNFLIVGLLTSFGAFIALGIYMRRSKASLWPLLIVCGGAAVLFFIML